MPEFVLKWEILLRYDTRMRLGSRFGVDFVSTTLGTNHIFILMLTSAFGCLVYFDCKRSRADLQQGQLCYKLGDNSSCFLSAIQCKQHSQICKYQNYISKKKKNKKRKQIPAMLLPLQGLSALSLVQSITATPTQHQLPSFFIEICSPDFTSLLLLN